MNAYARLGADVQVFDGAGNLLHRDADGRWCVQVEGTPNLVHELVHTLFFGGLDHDHGFPYAQMPLDFARSEHRRLLWEELTCCALSCVAVDARAAVDWFAEQVEILPVFFGLEDDPEAWRRAVDLWLVRDRIAVQQAEIEGKRALGEAVAPVALAPQASIQARWTRYRGEDIDSKRNRGQHAEVET